MGDSRDAESVAGATIRPPSTLNGLIISSVAGALWGAISYVVLWGHTPIVITLRFAQSLPGIVLLLPAKAVLFTIGLVERQVAGRSFDFSRNHEWIGLAATVVGALLVVAVFLLVRALRRITSRRPGAT
jgi:hypothetical protein